MNKQWTDDIRKRMERRQTAAPEGLLDDVKREMALPGRHRTPLALPHGGGRSRGVGRLLALAGFRRRTCRETIGFRADEGGGAGRHKASSHTTPPA